MNNLQNLSKIKQINNIELLRDEIDKFRPLSREQEDRIMQKFRLDWNYHSNVIEGNSLNFGETIAFLRHGLTAKGKPLKDHLDIRGHNNAINVLMDLIKGNRKLTENDIRELHEIILVEPYEIEAKTADGQNTRKIIKLGQYKNLPNHVKTRTGEIHYYATPEETPAKMKDLMEWFSKASDDRTIHPLVLAAIFHHKFVSIHPFDDGNGRMARILMNFVLMKNHYPPVVIKQQDRNSYYSALSIADAGDYDEFVILLAENLIYSLEIYLKGAKGESIDEPDDLDKELDLFMKKIEGKDDKLKKRRTLENQKIVFQNSIKPLLNIVFSKLEKFNKLFFNTFYQTISLVNSDNKLSYYYSNPKKNKNDFITIIEKYINTDINFNEIILVKKFKEFKNEKNHFSTEVKIMIKFEDYRYKISYYFSEINELANKKTSEYFILIDKLKVNNYYHQYLSEKEIENFANIIGHDLLIYIKNIEKNPDFYIIKFSQKQIRHLISKYHFERNSNFDIDKYTDLDFNEFSNSFTTIIENDYNFEDYRFIHFVLNKEKLNHNLGFIFNDKDNLPF